MFRVFLVLLRSKFENRTILKTRIALTILLLMSLLAVRAQSEVTLTGATDNFFVYSPKYEVRAMWLATIGGIDWPRQQGVEAQKRELTAMLDRLQGAGINTVLLQTRIRASVIYPSAIEPWDMCLTGRHGQSPGYDPLQFAIDECHRRNMELHAWVVTLPVGKWKEQRCKDFVKKNPKLYVRVGDAAYMNPEDTRTGDYLARICAEITRNYDVDGIHLDYCRYPDGWKIRVPRAKGREHITSIVRKIHQAVKELKPWVKLSCSPVGKHDDLSRYKSGGWNAYTAVCQDAQGWLRQGLMDQLYPMMYFRDNQFFPFALDWQEQSAGRTVAAGLGIYFLDPREGRWQLSDVTRQLSVIRREGLGQCYFRSKFLTDNVKGIYDYVAIFNRQPALVPPMTWAGVPQPEPLTALHLTKKGLLWWRPAESSHLSYNVYASHQYPVDTSRPENLVAIHVKGDRLQVPTDRYYAVCVVDRYGQESTPRQLNSTTARPKVRKPSVPLVKTDGKWLELPDKGATLDATQVVIETLQGQRLMTRPYSGKRLDIRRLPDGVYVLRSLGRKGVTHRLEYFAIKRHHE